MTSLLLMGQGGDLRSISATTTEAETNLLVMIMKSEMTDTGQ